MLWLQKSNPALFEHSRVEPDRLELPVNKRTIFHELALANPTKVRNAIAFNFVSYESGDVSQTRKKQNLPWRIIPGTNRRDIYGWKPSDYLVAKGAMDSLLWMCMWVMATHHIHGVCAAFKKQRRTKSPSVNFIWITQCLDLFAGPDNVLKQVPPELSVALGGADWPAAGKSPRQLAQDHGHKDIVEFIDFIQFHEEGSSLFSYVQSRAAFKDGSFKAAKLAAKTFSGFVEAGRANSKCTAIMWDVGSCTTNCCTYLGVQLKAVIFLGVTERCILVIVFCSQNCRNAVLDTQVLQACIPNRSTRVSPMVPAMVPRLASFNAVTSPRRITDASSV